MNKRRDIYYLAALLAILGIGAKCKPDDEGGTPNPGAWVICKDGYPGLTDGKNSQFSSGGGFHPELYDCPNDDGSPLWAKSQQPVYPPGGSGGSKARRKASPTPLAGASAYLAPTVLSLPFLPISWSLSTPPLACDSSFPDVVQVNHDHALVTRISTCPFAIKTTIPVQTRPLQIAITPDGTMALVTSFDNVLNFIDLSMNKVVYSLSTGSFNPNGVAISSDGSTAYITSFNDSAPAVVVIDIPSRTITGTIPVGTYPQSVYVTPDDTQLYVTFPFANQVSVIDLMTLTVARSFTILTPRDIAFNSKGTKAYITSAYGAGTVQQVNTGTLKVDNVYNVGAGPTDIAVMYGDARVVTNNYEGSSISVINVVTGMVITNPVDGQPIGLSIVR